MSSRLTPSTERVRRFRERQEEAGHKRIALYLDRDTQRRLDHLAGDKAQARYLETLVKAAIKREWAALESRQKAAQRIEATPSDPTQQERPRARLLTIFPGRRRSLAGR